MSLRTRRRRRRRARAGILSPHPPPPPSTNLPPEPVSSGSNLTDEEKRLYKLLTGREPEERKTIDASMLDDIDGILLDANERFDEYLNLKRERKPALQRLLDWEPVPELKLRDNFGFYLILLLPISLLASIVFAMFFTMVKSLMS